MNSQINNKDELRLDDESVANYLKTHPDFFIHQEQLLANLKVPHFSGDGTVSLIERQVAQLRAQKDQVMEQLNGLIEAARKNEQIVGHIQRFTLEMIHTHNIADVITACQENMNNHFKADFVGMRVLIGDKNSAHFLPPKDNALRSFTQLFKNRKPICGQITEKQCLHLFGSDSKQVKSAVLMPLQTTDNLGIIALGSKDESRFHAGMGTLFLGYMAELITASLSRHLD